MRDPNLLPPSLRINMNQFNALRGDEPTNPPRECNSQPLSFIFKYQTSPPKTIPVVFDVMGRLNHHSNDNGDVEVYPLEYTFESTSDSVPDPDNTPIKLIGDDEMYQLLEFFHLQHDDGILYVYLQMFQS